MPRSTLKPKARAFARQPAIVAMAFAAALALSPAAGAVGLGSPSNSFTIETLSTVPHLVSGGDVLVRVNIPRNYSMQSARVTLNGADVTSKFTADNATHSMTASLRDLRAATTRSPRIRTAGFSGGCLAIARLPSLITRSPVP